MRGEGIWPTGPKALIIMKLISRFQIKLIKYLIQFFLFDLDCDLFIFPEDEIVRCCTLIFFKLHVLCLVFNV